MKKFLEIITGRVFSMTIIFFLQVFLIAEMFILLQENFIWFYVVSVVLSLILVVVLINKDTNPAYKITWIIPILTLPLFGSFLYLFFARNTFVKNVRDSMATTTSSFHFLMTNEDNILEDIENPDAYLESRYLERYASCPVYRKTKSKYYPLGELYFKDLVEDMKRAKSFIFLEYFIIDKGYVWDTIYDVLVEKVKEGVDVRLIYDDFGCMNKVDRDFGDRLEEVGIKHQVFNPIKYIVLPKHNNRNHRKIAVIDGKIGYTGGLNLADEYINKIVRFGHWKDSGVRVEGQAVWSLTVFFLSMWNSLSSEFTPFNEFIPDKFFLEDDFKEDRGFVQPFADSPMDKEPVGENIYLNIINRAKNYVYITTPYLIMSSEMLTALTSAAKGGIDVRIITPYIADKKLVFMVTQSYYEQLISAGVKIYEYKPGFIHAKNIVSDDNVAVVSTINVDFRSLYLHFENGIWFFDSPIIKDIYEDFVKTLKISQRKTLQEVRDEILIARITKSVLRIFAPLL
ncbi:MAG: cardiolipin synthase [Lagierella massiliensis]|nr:cardiolipin synthase [Lagierella massiliensis]